VVEEFVVAGFVVFVEGVFEAAGVEGVWLEKVKTSGGYARLADVGAVIKIKVAGPAVCSLDQFQVCFVWSGVSEGCWRVRPR
jgi:hypothetical protein